MRAQHHSSSLVKGRVAKFGCTAKFKQNKEKDGCYQNAVLASQFSTFKEGQTLHVCNF